jgi:plastocyanin
MWNSPRALAALRAPALAVLAGLALTACPEKKQDMAPIETTQAPAAADDAGTMEMDAGPMMEMGDGGAAMGDGGALGGSGQAGSIEGEVAFTGTAPVMQPLKRGSDPVCAKAKMNDETVLVKDGKLQNVVVRLKGLPAAQAPTEAVVVDQEKCMYRPRVQGAVKGQPIQIKNSDGTLHNVHTYVGQKTLFNKAQPPKAAPIAAEASQEGVIKFKCDVHPWMTGYVVVSESAHFATSGADGAFTLKDVPAGTYTVEAWHEKLGTQETQVTVKPGEAAKASFTFSQK